MKKNSKILIALGAGIAIGGLLGILFAPRKGSESRKKIANKGNDLAEKVKDTINKGKDAIGGLKDEARQIIAMAKDRT